MIPPAPRPLRHFARRVRWAVEPAFQPVAESESGKFISQLVGELCTRSPDDSGCIEYDVNAADGSYIEIRNAVSGAAN